MAVVLRFFKWIGRVWFKVTSWVLFWRRRTIPSLSEHPESKKYGLEGVEKTSVEFDTIKLVKPSRDLKFSDPDEGPEVPESRVLSTVTKRHSLSRERRSLVGLSQTAVQSVSTLMYSAVQSGWQMCRRKSFVSSASTTSQVKTPSALNTREAEMLREVYLVLWVIRKQLRELAHRQERRHRRRHFRTHSSRQPDSVQALKQDARSPL